MVGDSRWVVGEERKRERQGETVAVVLRQLRSIADSIEHRPRSHLDRISNARTL